MAKIEVKHLFKIFGPRPKEVLALLRKGAGKEEVYRKTGHTVGLHDVSFSVEEGETFVVMGLSGSGKSTLIRCINRLIEPTAGEIFIDGVDVLGLPHAELLELRRKKVAMVFQRFALFPHRTVLQNAAYGLEVQGVPKREREERAAHWLEVVGLAGWERAYPAQLSGGMQQRVGLARALATDPEILLMDEAFSALDPLIRREMQDELIRLQSQLNKTIVFITHDLDEALRLGDRVAILKDGRVVQIGDPEEILTEPADAYVEAFVQDVNRARVLTARSVMVRPRVAVVERDGPRVALEMMQKEQVSSLFVIDKHRRYLGIVTVDDVVAAVRRKEKSLRGLLRDAPPRTDPDTVLEELLPVAAQSRWPIAVVDAEGVFLGCVPRVAILAALAGEEIEVRPDAFASRE